MSDIYVTRPVLPPIKEYVDEIQSIWENNWLTNMGPEHCKFERMLMTYLESEYVGLVVNGHSALELALEALNIKGEVITTPFTFVSTSHAIVRSGATPVFCDIRETDYTIDTDLIESLITEKTQAIMPVHVYGHICDVEGIQAIANKYGLKVIYDAAHAFGVKYLGNSITGYGDVTCYSFHATKVFNSAEGGAACTNNKATYDRICELRDFGIKESEIDIYEFGANAKMNELSAAMGICNLRMIDEIIYKRKQLYHEYRLRLSEIKGIDVREISDKLVYNYAYLPVEIYESQYGHSRDELACFLADRHIYARKYFYPISSALSCYRGKYDCNETPVALGISNRILTLPLYVGLTIEKVREICELINQFRKV